MQTLSGQPATILLLLLAGIALTLFIMRRRVRQGRRQGKF
ncbi:MAG: PEP-CTERM sorting domain-containing protein [Vicinamibacterales bacterium]